MGERMGIKKIEKLLVVAVISVLLAGFVGCDTADASLQIAELESSKMSTSSASGTSNGRQSFTATVNLYQDYLSVVTQDMGNSNHHKTLEETLYSYQYGPYGGTIVSDWDLLNGKNVIMTNVTNYNLDPDTTEISGSNHSVINIVNDSGEVVLSLNANGTLDGDLFGAEINMNWVAKDSDIKANGKVAGVFMWLGFDYETMSVTEILPNGTFTLTGTYK
jgi:hypothetical protein